MSATAPAPGTRDYEDTRRTARVRAREAEKSAQHEAQGASYRFAQAAAKQFTGEGSEAELEQAEAAHEAAQRALRRARAAVKGLGGSDPYELL